MAIEVKNKGIKDNAALTGNERVVLYDPAASDKLSVTTFSQLLRWGAANRESGYPPLQDLTISASSIAFDAAQGTALGTSTGRVAASTLTADPSTFWQMDGETLEKGADDLAIAQDQVATIVETLSGATGSPNYTHVNVTVAAETPTDSDIGQSVPWRIDYDDQWLINFFFQEKVGLGPVATHTALGGSARNATQATEANQPTALASLGGVAFTESTQQLTHAEEQDTIRCARWALYVVKMDGTGSGGTQTMIEVNEGSSAGNGSPVLWYNIDANELRVGLRGDVESSGGTELLVWDADNVTADYSTWNVVLIYRRFGKVYVRVNGEAIAIRSGEPEPKAFTYDKPTTVGQSTLVNDGASMDWAYRCWGYGDTELSEAQALKVEAWAHYLVNRSLPSGHTYENSAPVVDAEDFPNRYVESAADWNSNYQTQWANFKTYLDTQNSDDPLGNGTPSETRGNIGDAAAVDDTNYTLVFEDDFRAATTIVSSQREPTAIDSAIWFAPGWNTGIGGAATNITPDNAIEVYAHDAVNDYQRISVKKDGSTWYGGTIMSVNDAGYGRWWGGNRIEEVRVRFPSRTFVSGNGAGNELAGRLFPAPLWSYNIEHLLRRTAMRLEFDNLEFDGKDPDYLNCGSHHHHDGQFDGGYEGNSGHEKIFGGSLTQGRTGITGGINHWDGAFHTWQFIYHTDNTLYVNCDPDGNGFIEICRVDYTDYPQMWQFMLQNRYLIADYALFSSGTYPDEVDTNPVTEEYFDLDYIRVYKLTSDLSSAPSPFTGLPTISGTAQVGQTLTCTANLPGTITHIVYDWLLDGYPLQMNTTNTLVIPAQAEGGTIKCRVMAAGALNMPEAYSAATGTIAAA